MARTAYPPFWGAGNRNPPRPAMTLPVTVARLALRVQERFWNMPQLPPPHKQDGHKPRNPIWDLVLLALLTIVTSFLFVTLDMTEALVEFSAQHESWQLDEIVLSISTTFSIYAIIFAFYRWRDARLYAGQAYTDSLTGLYNRRILTQLIRTETERARRFDRPFSLIMFDLDNFKKINDTYGHARGDSTLQQVAHVLQNELRAGDMAARWGGDEFMILATNTDLTAARTLAERLRVAIATAAMNDGDTVIQASFGVCEYRYQSLEHLLRQTDQQLYVAKYAGRNRVA